MPFVTDSMTEASDTVLSSHTGELGATYTKNAGLGTGTLRVIGGAGRGRQVGAAVYAGYYPSGTPASADYEVSLDFYVMSLPAGFVTLNIFVRASTTAHTGYRFRYTVSAAQWQLHYMNAGTANSLGAWGQTLTVGNTYRGKLAISGTNLTPYVDAVALSTPISDANLAAAGVPLLYSAQDTVSDTTGLHFDNFDASDPAVAGQPTGRRFSLMGESFRRVHGVKGVQLAHNRAPMPSARRRYFFQNGLYRPDPALVRAA